MTERYRIIHEQSQKYVRPERIDSSRSSTRHLVLDGEKDDETLFELTRGMFSPIKHVNTDFYVITDERDNLILCDGDQQSHFKYGKKGHFKSKERPRKYWHDTGDSESTCPCPVTVRTFKTSTFTLEKVETNGTA